MEKSRMLYAEVWNMGQDSWRVYLVRMVGLHRPKKGTTPIGDIRDILVSVDKEMS